MKIPSWFLTIAYVLLLFQHGPSAQAMGGDEVNNGGGIAEKNMAFVYQNLENYLTHCIDSDACKLTDDEKRILFGIRQALPQERASNPNQLIFKSGSEDPNFFMIDGHIKVAKTGSQIGSPIYVNLDLLYPANNFGQFQPISLADAASILVHELGHHLGIRSHNLLDLLGAKVALNMQKAIFNTPTLPFNNNVSMMVINEVEFHQRKVTNLFPRVILYIHGKVIDATQLVKKAIGCGGFKPPVIPVTIGARNAYGAMIHNVHWKEINRRFYRQDEDPSRPHTGFPRRENVDEFEYVIRGNLSKYCKKNQRIEDGDRGNKIQIRFIVERPTSSPHAPPRFQENSLDVSEKDDAWWQL